MYSVSISQKGRGISIVLQYFSTLLFFLVDDVVNIMGDFYYDLKEKKEQIKEFIKIEEEVKHDVDR